MAIPVASEWRPRRKCAEELEEFVEVKQLENRQFKTPKIKELIQPVAETVADAITTAQYHVRDAREQFLEWIWKEGDGQLHPMPSFPPCPPCNLLCNCIEPTRIRAIDDCNCDCGRPGFRCQDCFGLISFCPYCGRRMPPQSRLDCTSLCLIPRSPPKPIPLPELVVTSVGPFRDKQYIEERPCSKCIAGLGLSDAFVNLAFSCGKFIGTQFTCCQREPPPMPVPGRPIQQIIPCFFPSPPPQRRQMFPFNLLHKEPVFQPPKGGLTGVIEDCCAVGIGTTGLAIDCVTEILDASTSKSENVPGSMHCHCDSPLLRYPRNGMYEDPPVPPTKATGCRLLDALNNFMDALSFPPSKPEDIELIKEAEIPETKKTGNRIVDSINDALDRFFPPPKEIVQSSLQTHDPLQALMTYFTKRPDAPDEPPLCPWLAPGEDGLNVFEKNLPGICLGQKEVAVSRCGTEQIDYVNFTLVPSSITESSLHESQAIPRERVVVPVSSL